MATRANSITVSRSAIMQAAWANYRDLYQGEAFDRRRFGRCLWAAWERANYAAALSVRIAEQEAAKAEARAADPVKAEIEDRIEALQYLPFRYNIGPMATAIRAELAA